MKVYTILEIDSYAMTAYRSPEVETLLNLLETVDWDSVNFKE